MVKGLNVDLGGGAGREPDSSVSTGMLVRLRANEPGAWSALWMLYSDTVGAWCRRAGLRDHDADDVRQEVFRSVSANLASFRREKPGDSFRGWLWTITQNKIRDHWRNRASRPEAEGGGAAQIRMGQIPSAAIDSSSADLTATARDAVVRALELIQRSFEPRTWKAFERFVVERRPAAEVAKELGMTANAVYIARSRILSRLRSEFGDLLT